MTVQTSTPTDPFALRTGDLDLHFADAKIIQAVLVPTMLQWQLDGGGFFVETQDETLTPEFVPATLITSQGQRRSGFGIQAFSAGEAGDAITYPVSCRTFWQHKGRRSKVKSGGSQNNGSPAAAQLLYSDHTPMDPDNSREVMAFTRFQNTHHKVSASRNALRP